MGFFWYGEGLVWQTLLVYDVTGSQSYTCVTQPCEICGLYQIKNIWSSAMLLHNTFFIKTLALKLNSFTRLIGVIWPVIKKESITFTTEYKWAILHEHKICCYYYEHDCDYSGILSQVIITIVIFRPLRLYCECYIALAIIYAHKQEHNEYHIFYTEYCQLCGLILLCQ